MSRIRIGLSGWNYPHWRGDFYPPGLRQADELAHAVAAFDTIEINRTFYSLAKPAHYRHWREVAPAGFRYALKGSRFITHTKRLLDVEVPLANFFASGVLALGDRMGPILWQLPGRFHFDPSRLDAFLALLPKDEQAAARLARRHDQRVAEAVTKAVTNRRIRHVLEVRDQSFLVPEAVRVLRHHGVALAFSHSSRWPYTEELTTGFVYIRLHGPAALYTSAYSEADLDRWAARIRGWHTGAEPADPIRITERTPPSRKSRDVYVYFDNDGGGYAPRQAAALAERLR